MPNSPIKIKTSSLFNFKKKSPKKLKLNNNDYSPDESSPKINFEKKSTKSKSPDSPSTSSDSPPVSPKRSAIISRSPSPESDALLRRKNNIKERDAFMASFLNDPDFAEAVENVGLFKQSNKPLSSKSSASKFATKRKRPKDETFRSTCQIPAEKRKSLRLQDKQPIYTHDDLVDETTFGSFRKRKKLESDDFDDIERVVYKPKVKRVSHRATERTHFLHVDDVTEDMLKKVAQKVSEKVYSSEGTSCHQCRQKTTDTKTFCRSTNCIGVRGQFCGVCLLNRYGEDAVEALKDPNWTCPMCRGICNCSFCRGREGKRPTGILTPLALQSGHKSVKDFLDSLRGQGDYADLTLNPKALIGFTKDLEYAQMRDEHKEHIGTSVFLKDMKDMMESFEKKLLENYNDEIMTLKI